jgi:hypothetical protein
MSNVTVFALLFNLKFYLWMFLFGKAVRKSKVLCSALDAFKLEKSEKNSLAESPGN